MFIFCVFCWQGNYDESKYKIYYHDTGLLMANLDEKASEDLRKNKNLGAFKGAIYENLVWQMLKAAGFDLYYYKKENAQLEMGFFVRTTESLVPVEKVSWGDAVKFCNKLSEKVGLKPYYSYRENTNADEWNLDNAEMEKWSNGNWENFNKNFVCDTTANGYRLPTVEEWQYAAKGGQGFKYSESDNIDEVAWYNDNSGDKTHPVAQKSPNGYGLYDMSGNVYEWCWDVGTDDGVGRYNCGGSWRYSDAYCEVGIKGWDSAFRTYNYLGFRIVRSTGK